MSISANKGAQKERTPADKKRVSCRLNGRMPEDRKAIDVYDRVLEEFGTNAAGDMLRRWVLGGFLVWLREGGLDSLEEQPVRQVASYNNESNTPSNNHSVLSGNESDSSEGVRDMPTEIEPAPASAPAKTAGFVGLLGMGLSQDVPPG